MFFSYKIHIFADKSLAMKKIVYVVGGIYGPNGMSSILTKKINYLAEHTDYELYMILTERPDLPWCYKVNSRVKWVNFGINFDELDTMPILKKTFHYFVKQRKYKQMFTQYLTQIRPDITVSTVRREINFINKIPDGSKKIGEIHFDRTFYRKFHSSLFPQSLNSYISRKWMDELIENLKDLDRFIVLTREDYEHWPELTNKKVISNFISEYKGEKTTLDSKAAIAVGRYTWQKGFDLAINAWQFVAQKHPDWTLHIYGSGDKTSYEHIVKSKGLEGKVICHPATKDIFQMYQASSFFVLSSRYEGLPLVLLEAMSTGLPAVSFTFPCGPKDIISDHQDGLLIINGNITELAQGICELIENPEKRKQLGNNAYIKAKQYYPDIIMKQWIELFESL